MNTLIESTKRVFGDRAKGLLDAGAIMPVTDSKTPAMRGDWRTPTDPQQFEGRSHYGYAIKTGAISGLTGVDFDGLVVPESFNTQTLRGFHSWVPYEPGDSNRTNINGSKVDVRGDGGFLVFDSPSHSVVQTGLLNREDFIEWLHPISPISIYSSYVYECVGDYVQFEYIRELEDRGYAVNLEWVSRALAAQLKSTHPGARNQTLYTSAVQVIHLGGSDGQVGRLVDAALESGLSPREVQKTLNSARESNVVIPHLHTALRWAEAARRAVNSPVVDFIVKAAAEQHTQRPLVSQKQIHLETGKSRVTVRAHLNRLIAAGHLSEKVNSGRQPNGMKHCNNFILVGPRHTLNISNREGWVNER